MRRLLVLTGLSIATLGLGIVLAQNPTFPPPPPPPPPMPAGVAGAQQATGTGLVLGRVVDAAGGGVPGAIVMMTGGQVTITQTSSPAGDSRQMVTFSTTVVNSGSGPSAGPPTLPMSPRRVMTDGQGQFTFHDLPKGNFTFIVTAPGYTGGGFGQKLPGGPTRPFELAEGEKVGDVNLRVWKMASISGTLVDEAGEPAVGMTVRAMRQSIVGGKRKLTMSQTGSTDDRGMYRLANLIPGEYVIVVPNSTTTMPATGAAGGGAGDRVMLNGQAIQLPLGVDGISLNGPLTIFGANQIKVGDLTMSTVGTPGPAPTDDGRVAAYITTFYPASSSSAQAAAITLGSGDDRSGVDLQLRLVPTSRISGMISGPDGPAANMTLRLLPQGVEEMAADSGLETATTVSDGTGRFTFLGVPQGAYTIKATKAPRGGSGPMSVATMRSGDGSVMTFNVQQTVLGGGGGGRGGALVPAGPSEPAYFAEVPVSVSGDDVDGMAVMLREGLHVSGRMVFEGNATKPTPEALQRASISLTPADARLGLPAMSGKTNPDGSFVTAGYPPGHYFVSPASPGSPWRLKSAMLNGRDVSILSLDLNTADVDGLVLTYMDTTTQLSGNVSGLPQGKDAFAMVFAFPANFRQWAEEGMGPRGTRSSPIGKTGAYTLPELPPGDYLVVAINAEQVPQERDAQFYEALSRAGTLVSIGVGEKKSVDLKVSQIR